MQVYTESTDGSYLDVKESALVWHYKDADPDFGRWQAKVLSPDQTLACAVSTTLASKATVIHSLCQAPVCTIPATASVPRRASRKALHS